MPMISYELDENDIKSAISFWIRNGLPKQAGDVKNIELYFNPGCPEEYSFDTFAASARMVRK